MLNIVDKNQDDLTTLKHGINVFHDALSMVRKGETRFHVTDESGSVPDYDLVYTANADLIPAQARMQISKMTGGSSIYSSFLIYDEDDEENLCLDFFGQFKKIEIECVDEYSIIFARLAIKHTNIPIYYTDDKFAWFFGDSSQLNLIKDLPSAKEKTTLRITTNPFDIGYSVRDFSKMFSLAAFQNLFFWQHYTCGKKGPFKYLEVVTSRLIGIGGILSHLTSFGRVGAQRGLFTFLRPGCTRYPKELLYKYFKVNPKPADANDENTIVAENMVFITLSWFYSQFPANFDESILDEKFASEMREYADAVIGGRKTLGVLARGTDYKMSDLGADRNHASADQMITVIKKWLEEDGYEKIFLATEDQDNFEKIRAAFLGKIIAISQERMSIKEMAKKGTTLIYEFEEKNNQGQDYIDALEDTTVNYFYALYILSKCDAFLCSGQCNGWDTVRSLRGGNFKRERKLFVAKDGDPAVEDWEEIRPITAGMFARGTYPTSKPFYMTFRFDLKEVVNPDAIKKAWVKTLSIYPYVGYAVSVRNGKLVLLKNDLPFVFTETSEVVEPYDREGNFHTVTFCYLENVLWIYADHVPYDGTGFKAVLETFFYHYYSEIDAHNYVIPDGIYTEKDGVIEGQEIDAYRMVDAIDPSVVMKNLSKEKTFSPNEANHDEMFLTRDDCRGYCISVPSDEFMSYVKTVGGSPMSMLSIFMARSVERVHPDNTLPISILNPISVRKVMGNKNSLLHQVVHTPYTFSNDDLKKDDSELNVMYREFLKRFTSEENIKNVCGVYRGICEGYEKAFSAGALDNIILEQRSKAGISCMVSYLGTLRTAEYGERIRMSAFHVMQEKGIMLQVSEVGGNFYIDWYQGFHGDMYAKAMRDIMRESGMKGANLERVE
ncbi:MAG: hypothetical protein K6A76_09740 [Oribacterium sp.]|nr:hypothetical protein [Oribacterium sp.]